jgi:carbon monoxide dehydrogenase subunit G
MQLEGERRIPASVEKVWAGLNDPAVLHASIPGCESLKAESADRLIATVKLAVGPISARFQGSVDISDRLPGRGYTLTGTGSAGPVGTAKGVAKVMLEAADGQTHLRYVVDVDVSGKIAGLGARLMRRVADANVALFFDRLEVALRPKLASPVPAPIQGAIVDAAAQRLTSSTPTMLAKSRSFELLDRLAWLGSGVGIALAVLMIAGVV